jgi:hypothetical protein
MDWIVENLIGFVKIITVSAVKGAIKEPFQEYRHPKECVNSIDYGHSRFG